MGKPKFKLSRQSVFFNWIFTYAIIISLILLVNFYVYQKSINTIESEIVRADSILLKNIQRGLDGRLRDVLHFSNQLLTNPTVRSLVYAEGSLSNAQWYALINLYYDFRSYKSVNQFVDSFFVYFNSIEGALTSEGYMDNEQLFKNFFKNSNIEYNEFLDIFTTYHARDFMLLGGEESNTEGSRVVCYVQSLSLKSHDKVDASIVILIEESKIADVSAIGEWSNYGDVVIIYGNNYRFNGKYAKYNRELDLFEGENGAEIRVIDGKRFMVSYTSSEIANWKYVSFVPFSIFMEKANYIKKTMLISLFMCLLTGGAAAVYFAWKNYNPIKRIVMTLSSAHEKSHNEQSQIGEKRNELSYITHRVTDIVKEKELIEAKLEEKNMDLRDRFVECLLKGKYTDQDHVREKLTEYKMDFTPNRFAVLIIEAEQEEELSITGNGIQKPANRALANIKKAMDVHIEDKSCFYPVETDQRVVYFVIIKDNDKQDAINKLVEILDNAQKSISSRLGLKFTAAVSRVEEDIQGIEKAYRQAMEAIEYRVIMGSGKIICYENILLTNKVYYYPIEVEQKLVNYIKTGNYIDAQKLIDEIFEQNCSIGLPSIEMIKCLLFDMTSTIIKLLDEIKLTGDSPVFDGTNPLESLFQCSSVIDMKQQMNLILKRIAQYVEENKKSHNVELKKQIIDFVDNNYSDMSISITMIAECLNVNPVYMSRFFREQTGITLIEYINQVRLEKAKELLKASEITIGCIAREVGYNNDIALIRAFKKYEGITPGKYKDYVNNENIQQR